MGSHEAAPSALPAGIIDPHAMAGAAEEVLRLFGAGSAAAAAGLRRHLRRHRFSYARYLCWTGCFFAWPFCTLLQGGGVWRHGPWYTIAGLVMLASPFAAGLLALRHRDKAALAEQQAAWARGEGHVMRLQSDLAVASSIGTKRLNSHDQLLELLQDEIAAARRIRDIERDQILDELETIRDALAAAFRAAGMTQPRSHLMAVPDPMTGPVRA